LSERRRNLNEQIADAIKRLYAENIERHRFANHYRQSRNPDKALAYLQRAAEQASEQSAVTEAESLLRDAIGILSAKPQSGDRDLREFESKSARWPFSDAERIEVP
jgi:predicted ATPase